MSNTVRYKYNIGDYVFNVESEEVFKIRNIEIRIRADHYGEVYYIPHNSKSTYCEEKLRKIHDFVMEKVDD
jgi:hypothetical protein